ncbi:hypothetical protein L596_010755 [Steinernema carpocapsae]|uniref:Myb-like domain-containing protein n=1 Tax=Steinernema carpocapsae TaxID=34508 RepID=A0A4U5PJS7_STECR|nr:hypothetical protein L596_010755 [Steinernema carpocapsae]
MSGRRPKVKVKPNIGPLGAKKKPKVKPEETSNETPVLDISNAASSSADPSTSVVEPTAQDQQPATSTPSTQPRAFLAGFVSPEYRGYEEENAAELSPLFASPPRSQPGFASPRSAQERVKTEQPETSTAHEDFRGNRSPFKSPMMSPRRTRTFSESAPIDVELSPKFSRRVFTGEEELDTQEMSLSDLISWNPRGKDKLKWAAMQAPRSELKKEEPPEEPPQSHIAAPQLKINPDGSIVLDESSLIVRGNPESRTDDWEVVDEDRVAKKISSTSFRKRVWRKGTPWTEQETEMFYELIQTVGTDFGLMHQFFPTRARGELKAKYNFEKRRNTTRLDNVLSNPALFDETLEDRAEALSIRVEEERVAKLDSKKNRRKKKVKFEDEEGDSGSDIEAGANPAKKRVVCESDEDDSERSEGVTRHDVAASVINSEGSQLQAKN